MGADQQEIVTDRVLIVTDRVLTVPNVISFIRLCMVPVYLVLLLNGQNIAAAIVFAVAAATDFLDGQIARRTHCVSKLGQLLDPVVDRTLMVAGVLGVFLAGRVPLWIILLIVARDGLVLGGGALGQLLDPVVDRTLMVAGVLGVFLAGRVPLWIILLIVARDGLVLGGGAWLLFKRSIRIPVIYPGKFATTFLFIGFAALILNWPLVPGLGLCDISWLPGFTGAEVCWGIWFIYAGLALSLGTTVYYVWAAIRALAQKKGNAAA